MALLAFALGCTVPGSPTTPDHAMVSSIGLQGIVKGGQQPVYNALIGLYAAGTTATYGSGASNLLPSPVYTLANGTFNISHDYTCPTPSTQVYLTATGGDPSGQATAFSNSAIQLVAALGPCGNLTTSTYINVDEVTTVAAAFALGQFCGGFGTTSDSIGAPASNTIGLTNAFATAHNLASVSTGYATPTTAASGTNYSLYSADQQKLNTIANILADCVNQTTNGSTVCSTLFADVTPIYAPLSTSTLATPPVNIFQAAVYMSLNPTSTNASGSQISNLLVLQTPYQPFSPALSSAPTDWTLAIQYAGTGINYNSSVAVDANGDIWMSNASSPGGVVMLNGGTGTVGGTAGVTGGVIGFYTGPSAYPYIVSNGTRQVAIDLNGKAWFGNFAGTGTTTASGTSNYYMFRAASGSGVDGYFNYISGATNHYSVAVDSSGEVFGLTSGATLAYISPTATSGTNLTQLYTGSGTSGGAGLAIDSSHNGYISATAGPLVPFTAPTPAAVGTTIAAATTGLSTPYGVAIDASNQLWVANDPSSSYFLTVYNKTNSTFTNISNSCLQKPGFIAIDGNGNAWVTNLNVISGTNYGVCVFNASGTLISNAVGYNAHGVNTQRGIAIDPSGNVWLTSYTSSASLTVTELVGAAAPAVTPIALAIKNHQVGIRPGGATASSISGGSPQSAQVNVAFSTALGVLVTDASGNPVPGLTITFTAPSSGAGATLSGTTAVTGTNGIASVTATANTIAGAYVVTASAIGVPTQSFMLSNTAGLPNTISLSGGSSQSAQLNTTFAQPLVAQVKDAYGNPVSGVPVTFTPPGSTASAVIWGTTGGMGGAASSNTGSTGLASVTAVANNALGSYSVAASATGVSGSISYALTNTAISPNVIAQVTVNSSATPSVTVPGDFVGLSHGESDVQKMIGYMPTYGGTITMNPIYEKLIDNLQSITGTPMVLRMNGDGPGPNTLYNALPVLNRLYADKGNKYFIGIDFENGMNIVSGTTTIAGEEVGYITSGALNPASIEAIELGNEPDGYASYSYTQYLADEQTFWNALSPIPNGLKFAAPVFAGNNLSYSENDYLQKRSSHVSMFDFHYYGGANCTSAPAQNALLLPSSLASQTGYQNNYPANTYLSSAIATAQSAGITNIRAGEMNSIACHGAFGVSDTFSSALWAMDMGMSYAAAGVTGINFFMSTDQSYNKALSGDIAYNAFDFTYATGTTRTWSLAYVAPEYYAMMMLDYMVANNAGVIASPVLNNPGRFSAWATKNTSGVLHVLLLNKEDGTNGAVSPVGTVQVMIPGRGTATVTRLKSSNVYGGWWNPLTGTINTTGSVTGETGITINGTQTFDGSTDGSIQGAATSETVTPANGTYTLNVPVANAVILTFQ
ncbi:MAG: Ig-like domain-containing protein [Acidobacteriaceae bacterium]|nr:Ig-like domain-containing protein [Acidobacteriaceae bacterium]